MNIGIIRYPGSNCDLETYNYFLYNDENNKSVKNNVFYIWHKEEEFPEKMDLLVIPGGFAFGDRVYNKATDEYEISPGEMAIKSPVTKIIIEANLKGIKILGICNGFQILTKMNLLPGELQLNRNGKFNCKNVKLDINICDIKSSTELYIANSYGRYEFNDLDYLKENDLVFLRYSNNSDNNNDNYCKNNIGSLDDIAGICNKERNVFGMMPHPERNIHNSNFKNILFKIMGFSDNINVPLMQNLFDLKISHLLSSEHISYKSTKKYLKTMHTKEDWVIVPPGENAGIIDIGNGYCIALRIESHNHPTFIDAYEGAATGVGGILRDIFTMGARPIALLDFLRFGTDNNSKELLKNAINGISYYGNTIGVPNVGGDLKIAECYNKNPLVNVGCIGILKKENIIYGNALNDKEYLIYVGSKTGAEGINGAAMASKSFSNSDNLQELKSNVQKADPYLEKLLLEACIELSEKKLAVGMQDMGAGGLLCASYEVVHRGREKTKFDMGCDIYIDKIPIKYQMNPYDILMSESQERMLIVAKKENLDKIFSIFEKWDLEYSCIGKVNLSGNYRVLKNNQLLYSKKMNSFANIEQNWEVKESENEYYYEIHKVRNPELWRQYDITVGNRTIKGPDKPGSYSVLDIPEANKKLVLTWGETFNECYVEMTINQNSKPLGIINCLNFGHPQSSMYDFKQTVDDLNENCVKFNVPVLGGNVSLYNATNDVDIKPTPIFLMVGLRD